MMMDNEALYDICFRTLKLTTPTYGDLLHSLPGSAELRPAQDRREHDPVPASALLHDRLRPADLPRLPAVPRADGSGADSADVRRQEHDVRRRPAPRPLPDRHGSVPRPHVDQGGR